MTRVAVGVLVFLSVSALFGAQQGVNLDVPQPLFPANNWWNTDISAAPLDTNSAAYITFIGPTKGLHPDFGGDAGGGDVYGFPVIVVEGTQPKRTIEFVNWPDQSDGVDHTTETSVPFYPVPDEAIAMNGWVEGGQPGSVDQRDDADRHILIVDKTNNRLYELYNVWFNGVQWEAASGAHFFMNRSDRRTDTWTSADAAGLAILPGLMRYEEVFGPFEIRHALRMTVRTTNGYVYPASHNAGSSAGALPMGARLRLKSTKNISSFAPEIQKIFRAFKKYGLIVADNGTDMYISGTYDTRWNNDILNPAFSALKASDFEVIQLGWKPAVSLVVSFPATLKSARATDVIVTAYDANGNVATGYTGTIQFTSTDGAATLPPSYTFTAGDAGKHIFPAAMTLNTLGAQIVTTTDNVAPTITGSRATNVVATLMTVARSTYWACFHFASKSAADARMASLNDNATLVATGYGDFPYVVIERWVCDLCAQSPEPLFTASPLQPGYTPLPNERVAQGVDGTMLLVQRSATPDSLFRPRADSRQ
ncbi:MAG TPA: hypothetical protein VMU84_20760 [Thermoanaerobaculia bacterium]|nr:hypothetical protein [Thermoanaerobaculia bacterium]